jgi:glycine hydroxymethyltransferase
LLNSGLELVGGGTETHLMVVDLTSYGVGLGTQVAYAMDVAGMYANRNTVPTEQGSPFYPSGLRLGTPLVTSRGMKEQEMEQIGTWIAQVVDTVKEFQLPDDKKQRRKFVQEFQRAADQIDSLQEIRHEVKQLATQFPLFQW